MLYFGDQILLIFPLHVVEQIKIITVTLTHT